MTIFNSYVKLPEGKNPAACRFYSNGPKSSLVKPSSVNVGERGEPPVWSLLAIHIVLGLSPIVWS